MTTFDFSIRPLMTGDLPAALALWRQTEGLGLGESDTLEALTLFLARNPGMSCMASAPDGDLVGAVLCGDDGRRGYLHHLAVRRDLRRRGIARALLAHCFAQLADRRIAKCNIFLFSDNTDGERFWLRQGWRVRGDLKVLQKLV
jgi:ribosomal protein S18 acetylase RimI-like enzyme